MKTWDAIVIGSGISGGWAAMELTRRGLETLVLEAGGVFTGPGGGEFDLDVASFVAASSAGLHAELCQTLARVPG